MSKRTLVTLHRRCSNAHFPGIVFCLWRQTWPNWLMVVLKWDDLDWSNSMCRVSRWYLDFLIRRPNHRHSFSVGIASSRWHVDTKWLRWTTTVSINETRPYGQGSDSCGTNSLSGLPQHSIIDPWELDLTIVAEQTDYLGPNAVKSISSIMSTASPLAIDCRWSIDRRLLSTYSDATSEWLRNNSDSKISSVLRQLTIASNGIS